MIYGETEVYHALEKLTPYLWRRRRKDNKGEYYLHWCQGCKHAHEYPIGTAFTTNWQFDGNMHSPSFTPSMHIFIPARTDERGSHPQRTLCHYFVTQGEIRYQSDCPHKYSGQNLPLQPIPENYGF